MDKSATSAFNHSPKDANTWPRKTEAARIPSGVLRTSWRQRPSTKTNLAGAQLGLRLCDVM